MVTNGGEHALYCLAQALINPGDEILMPEISYPAYPGIAKLFGAKTVEYKLTDKGVLNFRIYTYLRYLNQKDLDSTYTNTSGTTLIDQRQDIQVNKVNIQFNGWIMDPRLKYLFYLWTNNTAQGQTSQVVVAGNLQYSFNK